MSDAHELESWHCSGCHVTKTLAEFRASKCADPYCPMRKHLAPHSDAIDHPPHYKNHPSGVECIQITEHMNFCLGNALKYIWRADEKGNAVEDLKKARWYIDREIQRRQT